MRADRTMLFALLLIGIGVLLLLRQADVLPEGVGIWPIVLIGVGVVLLIERLAIGAAGGAGLVVPLVVIAIGTGFLLEDAGVIENDDVLLPLVAIAIGVGLVLGAAPARRAPEDREAVALAGAARGSVEIEHGAGELRIRSHLAGDNLLEGTFAGGIDVRERREGERLEVALRPSSWLGSAWGGRNTRDWSVTLSRTVPLELAVRTGAGRLEADLSDLRVESLRLETGAGAVALTTPSTGRPQLHVRAEASDVRLTVPARMAARIEARGGISNIRVDPYRFPHDGAAYRSPDYDEVADRTDVVIEAGAANVVVA
jgi:hypothetical protein